LSEALPIEFESQIGDFSRFQHSLPQHNRMPCLLCHKRDDNSTAPKLPGHMPCAGCHTEQFANNNSNICKICHTNPQTGSVKRFPQLRSFNARFDHAKHLRTTNCATCHKPAQRGVALSIPAGFNAHTSCFQCHSSNAQENMSSCGTCHQPGRLTRTSESARAFAVNFSHAEHGARQSLNCATCHTVRAGMARGRQVTAPQASMHFPPGRTQSCATCHNNRRAFGGDDFSDCKRCHEGNRFRF
jgi:c(7)-type cytochrome triheme protein